MSEAQVRRRVLVTGAAGMLGSQVLLTTPDGVDVLGTDLAEAPGVDVPGLDLTDDKAIASFFKEHGPFRGVIHTAAFTAVDKAEEEEELAERVNGLAPGLLAAACASVGIPMVLVSTDFVFDGEADEPYAEDAEPRPLSRPTAARNSPVNSRRRQRTLLACGSSVLSGCMVHAASTSLAR